MNHLKIKISISYHDSDVDSVRELVEYIKPISHKFECLEVFYRETIYIGENVEESFKKNLKDSEIILQMISPKYLSECSDEFEWIKNSTKGLLIPVRLRKSNIEYIESISCIQATPKSGKHLDDFQENTYFWSEVSEDLVEAIEKMKESKSNIFKLGVNIPIANHQARAGGQGQEYSQEDKKDFSNYIEVKGVGANAAMFPIEGDSMDDRFVDGDHVICEQVYGIEGEFTTGNRAILERLQKRINSWSLNDENKKYACVIVSFEKGVLLKYITEINFEKSEMILSSHNEIYPDLVFALDDIQALWQVKKIHSIRDVDF